MREVVVVDDVARAALDVSLPVGAVLIGSLITPRAAPQRGRHERDVAGSA